jgi:hypothetical protein
LITTDKEDQFVNIVKGHTNSPPNMNSRIKTEAKVTEELNQTNESNHRKGVQHTKARLQAMLKEKRDSKVMHGRYNRSKQRRLPSDYDKTTSMNYRKQPRWALHILREVLTQTYKTFITRKHITCAIYCNNRIAITLYSLENWFVQIYNCKKACLKVIKI